jgi:hypothetical protein
MSDIEQELDQIRAAFNEPVGDVTNSIKRPDQLPSLLDREPSSWRVVPLSGASEEDSPPSILSIGATSRHLLYTGSTNSIFGESESGKSWIALVAALEVIDRGGRVLWLDFEDNARRFRGRLDSMSVPKELWSLIDYVNPIHALWNNRTNASTAAHADFAELLNNGCYELAVVDTMTGAMSVEGLDPLSMTDVEQVYRVLAGQIVKRTGAAVLILDHVTKATEGRGRYAIGSERKLSGITGAAYSLEVTRPWSRALGGEPVNGAASLKIAKDRPGYVRGGRSELSIVASIEVTADPDGGLRMRVLDPLDTVPVPPVDLLRRIIDTLRRLGELSMTGLERELDGKSETIRAARNWLIDRGAIVKHERGNGKYLRLDETKLRELDIE